MFSKQHTFPFFRQIFIFPICLFCFVPAFSQQFSGYLNLNNPNKYIDETRFETIQQNFSSIIDSLIIYNTQQLKIKRTTTTELKLGASAGLNIQFNIAERWSVVTGLGLNYGKLKIESKDYILQAKSLRFDTINTIESNNSYLSNCDTTIYVGNYEMVDPTYTLLQLEVPLMLRYDIVPQKWSLGFGAKLSTPLYISQKRIVSTNTETVDDMNQVVCTREFKVITDKSGNRFSDVNIGLSADMGYWLGKIGFAIGFEKRISNLFAKDYYDYYNTQPIIKAKPLSSYFRVMYQIR